MEMQGWIGRIHRVKHDKIQVYFLIKIESQVTTEE